MVISRIVGRWLHVLQQKHWMGSCNVVMTEQDQWLSCQQLKLPMLNFTDLKMMIQRNTHKFQVTFRLKCWNFCVKVPSYNTNVLILVFFLTRALTKLLAWRKTFSLFFEWLVQVWSYKIARPRMLGRYFMIQRTMMINRTSLNGGKANSWNWWNLHSSLQPKKQLPRLNRRVCMHPLYIFGWKKY